MCDFQEGADDLANSVAALSTNERRSRESKIKRTVSDSKSITNYTKDRLLPLASHTATCKTDLGPKKEQQPSSKSSLKQHMNYMRFHDETPDREHPR